LPPASAATVGLEPVQAGFIAAVIAFGRLGENRQENHSMMRKLVAAGFCACLGLVSFSAMAEPYHHHYHHHYYHHHHYHH
jgi:hypothetical protein